MSFQHVWAMKERTGRVQLRGTASAWSYGRVVSDRASEPITTATTTRSRFERFADTAYTEGGYIYKGRGRQLVLKEGARRILGLLPT